LPREVGNPRPGVRRERQTHSSIDELASLLKPCKKYLEQTLESEGELRRYVRGWKAATGARSVHSAQR